MITEAVISFFANAARAVVGLIPSWTPPVDAFSGMATSFGGVAAKGNGYFPVVVLGICLAVVLGLKVALLGWRAVVFVYSILPFKAT